MPTLANGLRVQQLLRLQTLLQADSTLTGFYNGTIQLLPRVKPSKSILPTLSLYVTHENLRYASTVSHERPGRFILAILGDESNGSAGASDPSALYLNILNLAELVVEALYRVRADPQNATTRLWHKIIFGGDTKGGESKIPVGNYMATYIREPGVMQSCYFQFFLFTHLQNS